MGQVVHQARAPFTAAGFAHPRRNIAALGIEPGMSVADFGAGSGAYVFEIAEQAAGGGRVFAVDIQRDLLRRIANEASRRGLSNVEVVWADLETPRASKLADGTVNLVLISNLLFQVPEKLPVLAEARRIVKPNGNVAVIDWSESFGGMGPHKDDVLLKEDAISLAEKAGLVRAGEFPAGAHHYGLFFKPAAGRG